MFFKSQLKYIISLVPTTSLAPTKQNLATTTLSSPQAITIISSSPSTGLTAVASPSALVASPNSLVASPAGTLVASPSTLMANPATSASMSAVVSSLFGGNQAAAINALAQESIVISSFI